MPRLKKEKDGFPKAHGRLAVVPIFHDGEVQIEIWGDSEGFTYFAQCCQHMAALDLEAVDIPSGARPHVHLDSMVPDQAVESLRLILYRGEAKGTKKMASYLDL